MGWADRAIETLRDGEEAVIKPVGNSMRPKVMSKATVTLAPVEADDLEVGDIVLVRCKGRVYLHLIKAVEGSRFQIGNNRGGINGWVGSSAIYGRAIKIENP